MKKTLLIIVAFLFISNIFGQKTEYGVSFNSGLFSYGGGIPVKTTSIYSFVPSHGGGASNPYGSLNGPSYGFSGFIQKVSKTNHIIGVDLGYEDLRSKVLINQTLDATLSYVEIAPYYTYQNATGKAFLSTHFINLFPYIGHRYHLKHASIDLKGGFDLGYILDARVKGNATTDAGVVYSVNGPPKTMSLDFRPRIQVSANYHKLGVYAGYAYGLANYPGSYYSNTRKGCYSRLIRFGLSYKIK
jgi:hypothetical protein